ncbi:MAG: ComEC/Rec2 family competence protein [Chitinophagaceae bacterium]|nr:ComEC/Rec2 family competence protein [Chitinophagaceae bacterium]
MIRPFVIPVWKQAPFIRLLLPLVAGILLQWYFQISATAIVFSLVSFGLAFILFLLLPMALRYKLKPLQGVFIQLIFISLGMLLTWQKDVRHQAGWYGNRYTDSSYLAVQIDEPPVEKAKSFKVACRVRSIIENGKSVDCKGKLLLYFNKDSARKIPQYGDRILIHKNLQPIKNSGNPAAFDYQQYAAFQGFFRQVFLTENDWVILEQSKASAANRFWQFIYKVREYVLSVLRKAINNRDELGISEALLIGYTNDLDKDLVQAYSNTGVVHIIAISGMHLGLIYVLLIFIFARMPVISRSKTAQLIFILICLWLFAILTGASVSVLRAAVMFSCIAIGKNLKKQVSIYSSLAASAFILLCYNPYYLWAVGFQLSYLAVLGIVLFQKQLYHCFYIKNKWLDKVWQLMSVSTAAQILTFPVCIYYFHQFPNMFLLTNIVAVPLATVLLYAAIVMVGFSWVPGVDVYLGKLVGGLAWLMNTCIRWVNGFSFAVWDSISATVLSTGLLYAVVLGFSAWLIRKKKKYFYYALPALLAFVMQLALLNWQTAKQQKIIVYHVPRHQAIDFINGNRYKFVADEALKNDGLLMNFHLKPARIDLQLNNPGESLPVLYQQNRFFFFKNKKILLVDTTFRIPVTNRKTELDLMIFSKNSRNSIAQLVSIFNCKMFVFDASNPAWKIEQWKAECRSLGLTFYSVPDEGAFIYNIVI